MSQQLAKLRTLYHQDLCDSVLGYRDGTEESNVADTSNPTSKKLAQRMMELMGPPLRCHKLSGQTCGAEFARITKEFIERSFRGLLGHLRPGNWLLTTNQQELGRYEQYRHMAELARLIAQHPELKTALGGDYLITPDIVIARQPVDDDEINAISSIVGDEESVARRAPLRHGNVQDSPPILHASISCKWTMRSDRAQNTRTEALNLIRNRKGNTPHILVVTVEPLPQRIASIAMGTGDVDCTYHAALDELVEATRQNGCENQAELLNDLIEGRRLRDISDLPLDLAI